jgi:hypothetical protein
MHAGTGAAGVVVPVTDVLVVGTVLDAVVVTVVGEGGDDVVALSSDVVALDRRARATATTRAAMTTSAVVGRRMFEPYRRRPL